MNVNLILFGLFVVLLILNVPISFSLGISAIAALAYKHIPLSVIATNIYTNTSKFLLLAIPFFVLAGNIMAKAGISTRLIDFADACLGHKKGGMAIVTVVVACFFGAVSGSGPATVAALGAILIPAMVKRDGFDSPFSNSLLATASSIAIVIPPSIAYIVYASIVGCSVGDMFLAGIVPGILMGVALVVVTKMEVRKNDIQPPHEKRSGAERWKAFKSAFWAFLMPVIILGGIYGGIFTPTEAAAVAVIYGLIVGFFIYRELKIKDLFDIFVDTAKTTGSIMLIIACAGLFSYVCSTQGISKAASNLLLNVSGNKYVFLIIVNVIFLIAGCFVDANSAMYIFMPIMFPVAQQLGINLIHFGIIATVNLAIGQVTPPVGVNLFVCAGMKFAGVDQVTIASMSKKVWRMVVACLIVLLLVTYIPKVSLFIIGQ